MDDERAAKTEVAPMADILPHPMQPIGWDGRGVVRFKRNAIVEYLLQECSERGGTDLNRIALMVARGVFSNDDQVQFAQLIGYSVMGFGDLSYVPERVANLALRRANRIIDNP